MKFKLVGDHPEDLADGRVLAPGEEADIKKEDLEDPHNQRLIEEGILIELSDENLYEDGKKPEAPKSGRKQGKEGE